MTDDDLCTFCSGTRPPLPGGGPTAPATGPGGWGGGGLPRSPVGLSRVVAVLLGVVIATDLFAIGAVLHRRSLWARPTTDGFVDVSGGGGELAERLHGIAVVAQDTVFLAAAVVFVIWFHRTRRNAELFDPSVQRMGPGWAVGGWFVPVANFWFPYRVAAGVWEAGAQIGADGGRRVLPRTPLNLWWAAWVADLLFSRVADRLWERAEEPEQIREAASLVAVADALDLVAAALAIVFVRAVTRMQVERAGFSRTPPVAEAVTH